MTNLRTRVLDHLLLSGQLAGWRIAGVDRPGRLDQQDLGSDVRAWAVLDAAGHDVKIPRAEDDVAIAQLDRQLTFQYEEEVVRLGMRVPDEIARHLGNLQLVVVQVPQDPWPERLVELRELLGEVDLVVQVFLPSERGSPADPRTLG